MKLNREEVLKMADKMGIKYTENSQRGGLYITKNGLSKKISLEELFGLEKLEDCEWLGKDMCTRCGINPPVNRYEWCDKCRPELKGEVE